MRKTKETRRWLGMAMAVIMLSNMVFGISVQAEENDRYPYTLFASSDAEGAVTINSVNTCLNGDVGTNGTIIMPKNANINGSQSEQVSEEMIYIQEWLNDSYFSDDNVVEHDDSYRYNDYNLNINHSISTLGELELNGTISLNGNLKATDSVNLQGTVMNINNSVIFSENGDIVIDSTNTNFSGLIYAPYGSVTICAQNFNMSNSIIIAEKIILNCTSINASYNTTLGKMIWAAPRTVVDTEIDIQFYAMGEYDAGENCINIAWYTDYTGGYYEVWESEDNTNYTKHCTVEDSNEYKYVIENEFDTKYIQIILRTDKKEYAKSNSFLVAKEDGQYNTVWLDADGDDLFDLYEEYLGTKVNMRDTDGDGLSDYSEVKVTETDPLVFDSVQKGSSDAKIDMDGDGLLNDEEIGLESNPLESDTDFDKLSDLDELSIYKTNLLIADTDGDGIKDGDELSIGLEPTNPETYGVPDAEYKIKQSIMDNSEVFARINTDDNMYKLSMDITVAGYAEGNLIVEKTKYNSVLENDFVIGEIVDLEYPLEDSIEKVKLNFEISNETVQDSLNIFQTEEELSGIKRFNIFKYFAEDSMLLPVETQYDIDKNCIFTEVDDLGTYCIVDMEMWLDFLKEKNYTETLKIASYSLYGDDGEDEETAITEENMCTDYFGTLDGNDEIEDNSIVLMQESISPVLLSLDNSENLTKEKNSPVDVVFILQASGQLRELFFQQKEMIVDVTEGLVSTYGEENVRVCVVYYNSASAFIMKDNENNIWFKDTEKLQERLSKLGYNTIKKRADRGKAFELVESDVDFKENASKFVIQVMNGSTIVGDMYFDQIGLCARKKINYSELMPQGYYYDSWWYEIRVKATISSTKGIYLTYNNGTVVESLYEHICENIATIQTTFEAVVPTGWKKITLDGMLDAQNDINSDEDTLTDWQEIDRTKMYWDADGSIALPNLLEFISQNQKPYVRNALNRFISEQVMVGMPTTEYEKYLHDLLNNTYILPIKSDPTDEDTDKDGIFDGFDTEALTPNLYPEKYIEFINKEYIEMDKIYETDDGFTICLTPLCDMLANMNFPDNALAGEGSEGYSSIEYYFDDWYLYSVEGEDEVVYSIMKLRERENDTNTLGGVSIPFIQMNINLINEYTFESDFVGIRNELSVLTSGARLEHNSILTSYFKNNNSEALYLIPELYIDLVVKQECKVLDELIVDNNKEEGIVPCKYAMDTLNKYTVDGGKEEIYDAINNKIYINNKEELTLAEEQCILSIRSCSPGFNSFAAEIVYHAVMTEDYNWTKDVPWVGDIYKSGIKADLAVGEEKFGVATKNYKAYNGKYVKQQRNIWGDK